MARMLSTALAAALVGALALAGCRKNDNADTAADAANAPAAASPDAALPAATAPAAGPVATTTPPATSPILTGLDLGNAVGTDNRVTSASTSFAKGDTIHASIATNGDKAATVTTRWTYQDGQVVHEEDKSVPAGAQVTDFSISKPDGWPAGDYKVEVLIDGNLVQSRDFSVQ
ncbi:MAG TPA: hypothetical protein VM576_04985 [Xanthomonadaceae bacterium]|nr:hypothetical protein [Xanthomonadaceae bacterium]